MCILKGTIMIGSSASNVVWLRVKPNMLFTVESWLRIALSRGSYRFELLADVDGAVAELADQKIAEGMIPPEHVGRQCLFPRPFAHGKAPGGLGRLSDEM